MRLTSVHVANALTWDEITVPLESNGLTVFVGPNGSGKTNLFRVIVQLLRILPEGMGPRSDGLADSLSTLARWQRDSGSSTVLEVGLEWTEEEELSLFATFLGLALTDHRPASQELKIPPGFEQRPPWKHLVRALPKMVRTQSASSLALGVLGLRYQAPDDYLLYYKMLGAEHLSWILPPHGSGFGLTVPDDPLDSQHIQSFSQMWLRSLPDEERARLGAFLDKGDEITPVPQLSFSLSGILEQVAVEVRRSTVPAQPMVRVAIDASFQRQGAIQTFERMIMGWENQASRSVTLTDILGHLLARRIVVTDDLLSPPQESYAPGTWRHKADPLTSKHLGAYLLGLEHSVDDAARGRFSSIQHTFQSLTGRSVEVTLAPDVEDDSDIERVALVQRGPGDPRSTPLLTSGSGIGELVYLAAVLNLPQSHVLLLDEPGRALHPQALRALSHLLYPSQVATGADIPPQTLMITHSPYLVPTTRVERVRRVWRDPSSGVGKICRLEAPAGQVAGAKEIWQREDRWGRSPNWPSLLFSTAVLLVDGETEQGALPIWYQRKYGEPLETIGISLLCLGGKGGNGSAMRDLDSLSIPWVALIDGDSLKSGAGNIWHELVKAKRLGSAEEANDSQRLAFAEQVARLQSGYSIYVSGQTESENFEHMIRQAFPKAQVPSRFDGKVLRGRWYAEKYKCPRFLFPVLKKVRAEAVRSQTRL